MPSSWSPIRWTEASTSIFRHFHTHTQGYDVEDALRNAREVIELELEVLIERGEVLPASDGDADIRIERVAITAPAA